MCIRDRSKRGLWFAYCSGVIVCLLTQTIVMMQRGPKVYVSLLWSPLYPVQLFLTETCARVALALHVSLRDPAARGLGVAISSAIFGLLTVIWFPFPPVL